MGSTLVRLVHESRELKVAGAIESTDNPNMGKDAGEIAGVGNLGIPIGADLELLLKKNQAVVIEFTAPQATVEHARAAARKNVPIVIGTTGLNAKQHEEIKKLARSGRILISANMSLGVNLLV
ncbi:MAG TPA: 4-hydroxy-tetrahydrodipicolinate reductase, partial [Candidatus Binatia bacterium]|nr:4-hydroxy-tetrahydrodipicolinate reductase [Candidatus Binatia bacterium]